MARTSDELISSLQVRLGFSFGMGIGMAALAIHNGSLTCVFASAFALAWWMGQLVGVVMHTLKSLGENL